MWLAMFARPGVVAGTPTPSFPVSHPTGAVSLCDVTTTVGHYEAQLNRRNQLLEELWTADNQLRELHSDEEWKTDPMMSMAIHDLAAIREGVSQELREMGAAPWHFNIQADNCWLSTPRVPTKNTAG